MPLAVATDEINRDVTGRLLDLLLKRKPRTVAILGLTYKTATPVVEESQGVQLLEQLAQSDFVKFAITTHDPQGRYEHPRAFRCETSREAVAGAEAVIITTPWDEYHTLAPRDFRRSARIVDCWSVLDDEAFRNMDVVIPGKYHPK